MSALRLALDAKRHGLRFEYHEGCLVARDLELLPTYLRLQVMAQLGDILAIVAEQSIPNDVRPSDAVDAARSIAIKARKKPHATKL